MNFAEQSNSVKEVELAELIFDSTKQANATEGTRSTAAVARQLLFQAGSLCIDMCVQPKPGSDIVVLIGQLLDSRHPDHGIKDIPVQLLCEGNAISDNKTNDVGEFEFAVECRQDMQLSFGIARRRKLIVPLPTAASLA